MENCFCKGDSAKLLEVFGDFLFRPQNRKRVLFCHLLGQNNTRCYAGDNSYLFASSTISCNSRRVTLGWKLQIECTGT